MALALKRKRGHANKRTMGVARSDSAPFTGRAAQRHLSRFGVHSPVVDQMAARLPSRSRRRLCEYYICGTSKTAAQRLTIWGQPHAALDWRCCKTRMFHVKETVHPLQPEFRRSMKRCRDCLPV